MTDESYARPAFVAGMFYPEHERELKDTVDALLAEGQKTVEGTLIGIIVPHAGYMYSGGTAARAYALLKGLKKRTVILIGPSHREYFDGVSVFSGASFATPLGVVRIDNTARLALMERMPALRCSVEGHRSEHSLEVQIPFLQRVLPDFKIVPIVIGNQKPSYCEELGTAIAAAFTADDILLVASSDLSHYHRSEEARQIDAIAIDSIRKMNYVRLMADIESERTEACGGGPIAAVLRAASGLGADACTILHSCNSGEVSGENERVVGYVSAALWKAN